MVTMRVMMSGEEAIEPRVRVEATLGLGFAALPVFEQERIVEEMMTEARDRVLRAIHPALHTEE